MAGLAELVLNRRRELGMTQEQLAARLGVRPAHLSQIETGAVKLPAADLRRALAATLGVRHVDILVAGGELLPEEVPLAGLPAATSAWDHLVTPLSPESRRALVEMARTMAELDARSLSRPRELETGTG